MQLSPAEWVELLMNANDPLTFVKVIDDMEQAFGPSHASAVPDLMVRRARRRQVQAALSDLGGLSRFWLHG